MVGPRSLRAHDGTARLIVGSVLGGLGLFCAPLILAALLISEASLDGPVGRLVPVCPARAQGGSCPACGLSHAFVRAAHGDFQGASRSHPLGVAIFLACAGLAVLGPACALAQWSRARNIHAAGHRRSQTNHRPRRTGSQDSRINKE
ncbi:MAG: DUF2752 domain-containing protein [Vicinamibacteria bacterium]|nr:DUF2752 domain-containing protein [Vicinamibacteria bacterium]